MGDELFHKAKGIDAIDRIQQYLELHTSTGVIEILGNDVPSRRMPNQNKPVCNVSCDTRSILRNVCLNILVHPGNHFYQDVGHNIGQRGL